MEYLALYRKYRPSNFDEMVGQEEIKKILSSSVINNTISHAYLFSGPRGTGKTSTAKIFAKLVNCENPVGGNPCNSCSCCNSFSNSSDIIEIDAASNNGVDEIRELREKANLVPSFSKYKVYIIDEVHMLTTQAFNALLKTLEEPPKHVIFILATTEYHKVPLTISSRCQKFQFTKLNVDDNFAKLKDIADKENISITDDALREIAILSDGGMRDSINYLDQIRSFKQGNIDINDVFEICGNVSFEEIRDLLINLKNNNVLDISEYLENIGNNGKSYSKFLEDILLFLKEALLLKNGVSEKNIRIDCNLLNMIINVYSFDDIYCLTDMIDKLLEKLKFSSRQSILVVSNFLLIANKFNCSNEKDNIVDDTVSLNFKNTISQDDVKPYNENLQLNDVKNDKVLLDKSDNFYYLNKDIIINNAFATASKENKNYLQNKLNNIDEFMVSNKFKSVASLLVDCKISVASDEYAVFNTSYDSTIENIYSKFELIEELFNKLFEKKYYFAFISDDQWDKYKNEYINAVKAGNKYILKELIFNDVNKKNDNIVNNNSYVDKLIDIVGDDVIEFK